MAKEIEQDVLSPEEQLLKEQIDSLLEKVDPGHGEPMQVELAGRLDKTVNEFHDEIATVIECLKASSDERRSKLKDMWAHRNDQPIKEKTDTVEKAPEEAPAELSSWEQRLESKKAASKGSKTKAAEQTNSKEEKPKKKGFFKRKK